MIFQLLSFSRHRAKQRPSGQHQILALLKITLIHQKVFLFQTDHRNDAFYIFIPEDVDNPSRRGADRFNGFQKRRFFIERLAVVGNEDGRNAQDVVANEGWRGAVPIGIAAGFKSCAQAAAGKAGGVRFALDQRFAGKAH